jgi:pilus assembly protein CpaB
MKFFKKPDLFKHRTAIGIVCLASALIIGFILVPLVTNVTGATTFVIRAKQEIPAGTQITTSMLERVRVGRQNLPSNVETNEANVVNKYTTVDISAEDMITTSKLSSSGGIYNLQDGQYLMSVPVKNLADGLSGMLQGGDIVTVFFPPETENVVAGSGTQSANTPPELQYVEVAAVTASNGADTDANTVKKQASGSNNSLPATVTLLVNARQAQILASEENNTVYLALACHGGGNRAQELLQKQADYFIETNSSSTSSSSPTATSSTSKSVLSSGASSFSTTAANKPVNSQSNTSSQPSGSGVKYSSAPATASNPALNWGVSQ